MPTFVAFDLAANSCAPAALPSQSVIGEINLLATVIPVRDRELSQPEYQRLGDENGFSTKLLPDPPNYKQVHTDAPRCRAALA